MPVTRGSHSGSCAAGAKGLPVMNPAMGEEGANPEPPPSTSVASPPLPILPPHPCFPAPLWHCPCSRAAILPPHPCLVFWNPWNQHHTSEQVALSNLTTPAVEGTGGKIVEACKLVANEENEEIC